MIAANTSYKQNGVPVSIPSGSYGIAHLTVHQYEYPKGHPCHNCPYTLRTSVPSCMFPERRDGGCLWYDLKKQRRPPLPALYPFAEGRVCTGHRGGLAVGQQSVRVVYLVHHHADGHRVFCQSYLLCAGT